MPLPPSVPSRCNNYRNNGQANLRSLPGLHPKLFARFPSNGNVSGSDSGNRLPARWRADRNRRAISNQSAADSNRFPNPVSKFYPAATPALAGHGDRRHPRKARPNSSRHCRRRAEERREWYHLCRKWLASWRQRPGRRARKTFFRETPGASSWRQRQASMCAKTCGGCEVCCSCQVSW